MGTDPCRGTIPRASQRPSAPTSSRRLRAARRLGIQAPALTRSPTTSPRGRLAAPRRTLRGRLAPWPGEEEDVDEDLWIPSFRAS